MKIGGIQPLTLSDYAGHCAAIIFTIGCNFRCPYCYNQKLLDENCPAIPEQEVLDFLKSRKNQLDAVVISGGEPTMQPDLIDFIRKIKQLGYKVKIQTNGSNPDCLKQLLAENLLDFIAMDIKAPFETDTVGNRHVSETYNKLSGVSVDIEKIKQSIALIVASGIPYEFRTTWDKRFLTTLDIENIKKLVPDPSKLIIQECILPS